MITLEALDDLIQAGATASKALRRAVSDPALMATLDAAQNDLSRVGRDNLLVASTLVKSALNSLISVANKVGDTGVAQTLSAKMQAAGLGTNWFVILGLGAGAVALYFLWQHYYGRKSIMTLDRADPEPKRDLRPQIRGMHKALGSFSALAPSRRLGSGPRRFGAATDKYEFEPEIRLEGMRRKARSKR